MTDDERFKTSLMTYREHAEVDLALINRELHTWWQPLATAGIYALLAIAKAIERLEK